MQFYVRKALIIQRVLTTKTILVQVIEGLKMIKTVGVKNLMFHFYNDLLFLKFTAWIVKEMTEFQFQYFPGSTTTLPNAEFISDNSPF